jgi:FAD synthetase
LEKKRVIGAVFSLGLTGGRTDIVTVADRLEIGRSDARREIRRLVKLGLAKLVRGRVRLTERGRASIKVVFIGGGFEVIHQGHLYTIEQAKRVGDVLVVSVARDSTIRKRKKREPVANEEQRVKLLSSLRQVDAAILGVEGDIYETLEKVDPDVVALGYDQYHLDSEVAKEANRRGMKVKVTRLDSPYPSVKTSSLLNEF